MGSELSMDVIDVWNAASFDSDLRKLLDENADLIRNYVTTDKANFLAFDLAPQGIGAMRPANPFAVDFIALRDKLSKVMESRTIRGWHYTRLTDEEVANLKRDGIHLSTPETLRRRLDALIDTGDLTCDLANELVRHSPFNSDQHDGRTQRFWLTSHPQSIKWSGVTRLLGYWGGEVASFHTDDPAHLLPISTIGAPRVVEIAVPLQSTKQAYSAGMAVIAAYARAIGCVEDAHGFDISLTVALPASHVLHVHSAGDGSFSAIGSGYPIHYIDVRRGYWKDLTGEDD